jgi:hypothetical protein
VECCLPRCALRSQRLVSQSHFATDGRSVGQFVLALSPSGTHDQILAVVKTVTVLLVVGRRENRFIM